MTMSRRELLRGTGALVAVSALGAGGALGLLESPDEALAAGLTVEPSGELFAALAALSYASFAPAVGTPFRLRDDTGRSILTRLVRAEAINSPVSASAAPAAAGGECFRLEFESRSRTRRFGQGTYRVSHRDLGRFALFLVPAGETNGRPHLQAIINRLAA